MVKKIVLALMLSSVTAAFGYTGTELLPLCKEAVKLADVKGKMPLTIQDAADIGRCLGYVDSIIDYNVLFHAAKFSKDVIYCPPPGTDVEKDLRIIVKYLEDNPKKLAEPGNLLATQALHDAFPCKEDAK